MSDNPEPTELSALLAKLENKWEELADLLKSQGQPLERVIEVEKILFRDASGKYRGKISVEADGSCGLLLSDQAGKAWVWLGVTQNGEAFCKLKDQHGDLSFTVPGGSPSTGAGPKIAATPAPDQIPGPAPDSFDTSVADQEPVRPAAVEPPPASVQDGGDAKVKAADHLENSPRQNPRQKFYQAAILVLLGLVLTTQAFLLFRPAPTGPLEVEALVVRDRKGVIQAFLGDKDGQVRLDLWDRQGKRRASLGLGADGSPDLALYDREQRLRANLSLGPDGDPKFDLRDNLSLESHTVPSIPDDSGTQSHPAGTVAGSEAGAEASPPVSKAETVSPAREAEAEVVYVGSKTSNKYHLPGCKWAKMINPSKLITFKSVKEAQERGYHPCPVCKPPPLGK